MDTAAIRNTMTVIGGKWKAPALLRLKSGPTRFNALKRELSGVTQRMLAQQLRELEADGIVSRHVLEVVPPHVEYALTPRGATLVPILNWLAEWGEANAPAAPPAEPFARKAKAEAEPFSQPNAWRYQQIDVQSGGLPGGTSSNDARLVLGAVDLAM